MCSPDPAIRKQSGFRSGEFELVLPASVRAHLDLSTLQVRPGTFRDKRLQHAHTDLLYTVRTTDDREALVYVLFEHQSSFDATMPLRLLRYMVRIWERCLEKRQTGRAVLPIIIPVLLHHGERGWHSAPELSAMLDASPGLLEATRSFVPHYRFVLDDLASPSLDELAARTLHALARIVQMALSASRPFTRMRRAAPLMGTLHATLVSDARTRALLGKVYEYIVQAAPTDIAPEDIRTILQQVAGPQEAEDAMSYADKLIEQGRAEGVELGRAEGVERGRAEGLRDAITRVLTARKLGPSEVARTRLASSANVVTLTAWLDRALTASSELDVFAARDEASAGSKPAATQDVGFGAVDQVLESELNPAGLGVAKCVSPERPSR